MFKALLKTRMAAFGTLLTSSSRSGNRKSKIKNIAIAALILYTCVVFMGMFGMYFDQLAKAFYPANLGWLYFTLFGLSAFALMFIGSIFTAKTQLYEAKDNDLLLSMPIPPKYILGSRMVMLMILNFAFELFVALPAIVMWFRAAPFDAGLLISFIVVFLALPFLSMALSGLFGWLITLLTGRIRKKTFITVLFSLIFLGLYFFFFSRANIYIQKLVMNGQAVAGSFGSIAPLFWLGNAIAEPNIVHLILSLVIMILPFLLMYYVLSATFIRLATSNRGSAKVKYEERAMHMSSQSSALFRREMKHLLSSSGYLLNAGLGVIFIFVGAAALVIKKNDILKLILQMNFDSGLVAAVLIFALCLLASTILFTAPSISIEGKTIWIIKSIPVKPQYVLKAKLHLHTYITIPAILLVSAASIYVFSPPLEMLFFLILTPSIYVMLSANIGLMCNLKHPNLKWTNETQAVKQSLSVMLTMLISSAIALIPAALYYLLLYGRLDTELFILLYTALLILGWYLSFHWLMTKGAVILEEIE